MAVSSSDMKERLAHESQEFKKLYETHKNYESRLMNLSSMPYLSADQELEIQELKKKKLHLKDQMQVMISEFQTQL